MTFTAPRKKIAIIASSAPPIVSGGISSAHYNLFKALQSKEFDVQLYTYSDHGGEASLHEKCVIRHGTPGIIRKLLAILFLPYDFVLRRTEKYEYAYQFRYVLESAVGAWKINKSLREFGPDVVILPDNGSPGFFIEKMEGCKYIFIAHHNYLRFIEEPPPETFSVTDARLSAYFEKKSLNRIDKVICPSHYMKGVFERTHNFAGNVTVISNIVDSDTLASIPTAAIRGEMGLSEAAPLIYIPSAGSYVKGSQHIAEIIQRLTAIRGGDIGFYLSGTIDPEDRNRLLSCSSPNAKLHMPGHTSYFENIALIKACSFCVSPALMENFGMAILEANFCSLPVVAFNVGGNSDIIDNGINGFLAPNMDVEELVRHAVQLFDPCFLKELRDKTYQHVNSKFARDSVLDRYIRYLFDDENEQPDSQQADR